MDWLFLSKVVTAIVPVFALLMVFDRLDLFNLIRLRMIMLLVGVGGVIAALSYLVNWRVMDGFPIGFSAYSRYVAPAIEEALKAAPVVYLFATNRVGFKLDSAIAGFAIGAGFSMVENAWYLSQLGGANYGAWLVRGFGTAVMHGGATALFAAISHEMTERQAEAAAVRYRFNPLLFAPGYAAAYALHAAFNHFASTPTLAMALTLLLVPMTLFVVFSFSEGATRAWLAADRDAHKRALEAIRDGGFAETETGKALDAIAARFHSATAATDVRAYLELKTELVLRAEEAILAAQSRQPLVLDRADREKLNRLEQIERRLGRSVLAALAPTAGFSRNDLWELDRYKTKVRELKL